MFTATSTGVGSAGASRTEFEPCTSTVRVSAHSSLGKCRMKICFGGEETSWLIVEVVVKDKDTSLEGACCFRDRGVYFLLVIIL